MTTRATPLLLLHTWGGDATTWAPALGHLGAGGRHVTALDLPGHGARAAEPFTVDGAVDAALSAYGTGAAGPVDVVGAGLGALVALALTERHQDRVRSLTLVGFPPADGAEAARRPADTRAALERDGTAVFARNYVDSTLLSADPDHRDLLRRAMAGTRPEVLLDSLRATLGWRAHTSATALAPPCRVLRGARDHRVAARRGRRARRTARRHRRRGARRRSCRVSRRAAWAFAAALTAFHDGIRTAPAD